MLAAACGGKTLGNKISGNSGNNSWYMLPSKETKFHHDLWPLTPTSPVCNQEPENLLFLICNLDTFSLIHRHLIMGCCLQRHLLTETGPADLTSGEKSFKCEEWRKFLDSVRKTAVCTEFSFGRSSDDAAVSWFRRLDCRPMRSQRLPKTLLRSLQVCGCWGLRAHNSDGATCWGQQTQFWVSTCSQ